MHMFLATERIAAFIPGESPPEVITPIFLMVFAIKVIYYLGKANKEI